MKELVKNMTTVRSNREWKHAMRRAYSLFGKDALYYLNCDRFARDEEDEPFALPYDVWENGELIHFGVEIQHTYIEVEEGEYQTFSYGSEVYLLA